MLLEALRLLLVLALFVALPGYLLARALFPRSLRMSELVYVTLAGGIFVVVAVGSILGFLPHAKKGHLQTFATGGLPNAELAILGVSALLFWVALMRGAFPRLAARFPSLTQKQPVAPPADSK